MKEPTYKPHDWIAFEQGDLGGFGQVIGGSFSEDGWEYIVSGSLAGGSDRAVREDEISLVLQNGSWLAPSHFGGHGSAYTEPNA